MKNNELLAFILSIGAGLFAILASIFNWVFFFENRKAKTFTHLLGRKGSRIFYAHLGVFLLYLAYALMSDNDSPQLPAN